MKILGINSNRAAPPRKDPERFRWLADGGAALLVDGTISSAVIEERFTRKRYEGGFRFGSEAVLRNGGIDLGQVDAVGHSTCCDIHWNSESDILDDLEESLDGMVSRPLIDQLKGRVFTVDHHDSHCALAFAGSGYTRALVVVVDGMGNRIGVPGEFQVAEQWWRGAFQRHTCYLCEWRNGRIQMVKVQEDANGENEIGLGEIYRGVTHFLGWPTYQHAGKTMALAAFGDPQRFRNARFVEFEPPYSIRVPVRNLHNDPHTQVLEVLRDSGYDVEGLNALPADPSNKFACDVAAALQDQLESAFVQSVSALADRLETQQVAFGGGVAMNCVALGKLAIQRPTFNLYVPPAPSDTGMALGNAIWLAYSEQSPVAESKPFSKIQSAALGVDYDEKAVSDAIASRLEGVPEISMEQIVDQDRLVARIVEDLAAGVVVCIRQGRSEFGPRALGQASILADPRSSDMHAKVNSYKKREPFRPYAPSILQEHVPEYFEIDVPSPFMSFAARVRSEKQRLVPAVVHIDGTARYQSVGAEAGFYRKLLEAWYRVTGIPVLLNTSFNMNGEPIVETPEDAINSFLNSGIPVLILENWYLRNTKYN